MKRKSKKDVSPLLRNLVHEGIYLLGEVLKEQLGVQEFQRIENLRRKLIKTRTSSAAELSKQLSRELQVLRKSTRSQRLATARAFTLLLQLINACENAYRSYRISLKKANHPDCSENALDSIVYVLTAHPTEARTSENIWIFHQIQNYLFNHLKSSDGSFTSVTRKALQYWITLAWKAPLVRNKKPEVTDEIRHILSTTLREESLHPVLQISSKRPRVLIRTWVGGDRDGHPGVTEKTFHSSLLLSRNKLLDYLDLCLREWALALEQTHQSSLLKVVSQLRKDFSKLRTIEPGDGAKIRRIKKKTLQVMEKAKKSHVDQHPRAIEIPTLFQIFPALVVPIEFREDSDVVLVQQILRQKRKRGRHPSPKLIPIEKMLQRLKLYSHGGNSGWYVRGLILSMADRKEHVDAGIALTDRILGNKSSTIPVIPLLENAKALKQGSRLVENLLQDRLFRKRLDRHKNVFEVMVGYSDSSKESGVLQSRVLISKAIQEMDRIFSRSRYRRAFTPVFFHGSGGSVDRGGGTIENQTAWWPQSALQNTKLTIQGEMVERSFASPEIIRSRVQHFCQVAQKSSRKKQVKPARAVVEFAQQVALEYQKAVRNPEFLSAVEQATPYRYLDLLNLGSRPSKRKKSVSLEGLRAIPWVLCWTQTRCLFVTWWGVGSAWSELSPQEKSALKRAIKKDPLFNAYFQALGFTLSKVQLGIWHLYLNSSSMTPKLSKKISSYFDQEFRKTQRCMKELLPKEGLLSQRPWLETSIYLRSPMIHPLNLLQIIALQEKDFDLLRLSVVGVSSGMLTTG